ncbi:MAG TPA: MBG domain-containing protein, partial [Burkholderiales bacterium]|nr:MBG domain-containing protein [Burkholderiales bacterium]
ANNASRNENLPNPPFSATYSGLKGADSTGSLSGTLLLTTPAILSSPAGSYSINPSGVSSSNYTITYVPGVLSIGTLPPGALNDPLATSYGAQFSLGAAGDPGSGTNIASSGDSMFALAGTDGTISEFLNRLPPSAAGGEARRQGGHIGGACSTRTPFSILRCSAR